MTIILGDLHFGKKGFSLSQYENQISFFQKQLFPYIRENKIKHVICLGDLFDHRTKQDVNLLLKIRNEFLNFFEENEVMLTTLIGNHDIYFNNSRDVYTLQLFDHYKYLNIIKEPTLIDIGNVKWELFPWMFEDEIFEPRSEYIMGHLEINGFSMAGNFKCVDGMNVSSLKNMEKVLSGHFHIRQEKGPINYVGTPYALDWNDYNQDRGFHLLNDDGDLEFIENTISNKFYEVKMSKIDNENTYQIEEELFTLKEINDMSEFGHKIRILSSEELEVNPTSNIIVNIEEKELEIDDSMDINLFIKSSLSEKSYKEFNKLYSELS